MKWNSSFSGTICLLYNRKKVLLQIKKRPCSSQAAWLDLRWGMLCWGWREVSGTLEGGWSCCLGMWSSRMHSFLPWLLPWPTLSQHWCDDKKWKRWQWTTLRWRLLFSRCVGRSVSSLPLSSGRGSCPSLLCMKEGSTARQGDCSAC